jgi:transposase
VDLIGQIRRAFFGQRRAIKEISRELRVSRTTVRKVVRSDKTAFKYAREVQPAPKLGEWVEVLTAILEAEATLPKRERRSTQRLFEELRGRGYDGAHDSVHRFVKEWREERARVPAQAFVPMSFAPGEAYQFDWSHETITLQGLPLMVKAAHMKLSYSRMPFVRVYFRETQELVFDAHDKAFVFYGGACRRGIYDLQAPVPVRRLLKPITSCRKVIRSLPSAILRRAEVLLAYRIFRFRLLQIPRLATAFVQRISCKLPGCRKIDPPCCHQKVVFESRCRESQSWVRHAGCPVPLTRASSGACSTKGGALSADCRKGAGGRNAICTRASRSLASAIPSRAAI